MIVHYRVCDFCGNQRELKDLDRRNNSLNDLLTEQYDLKEKTPEPKQSGISISILTDSIIGYSAMVKASKDTNHLTFCGKACLVEYIEKHLLESGNFDFEEEERKRLTGKKNSLTHSFLLKSSPMPAQATISDTKAYATEEVMEELQETYDKYFSQAEEKK